MWLLDAETLSLKRIADRDLESQQDGAEPRFRYGILSHRWEEEDEEPTFDDYRTGPPAFSTKGTRKIEAFCRAARSHNLDLVWSDTCCIDRKSSAELSEAINSMYRYYERTAIGFVYLRDVSVATVDTSLANSEWFERGWTLQELLAPTDLHFYDCDWKFLGDKKSLSHLISTVTGIREDVLLTKALVRHCSVAERMSWAAGRVTTRVEDRAYSLLGIFDINMPMLYGEGSKAFQRLQEEIMKTVHDHSIFAWDGLEEAEQKDLPGLLAASPDAFELFGDVTSVFRRDGQDTYISTNRGLQAQLALYPYTLDTYLAILHCVRHTGPGRFEQLGIFVRRLFEDDEFIRVSVHGRDVMENVGKYMRGTPVQSITIRRRPLSGLERVEAYAERIQGFRLNEDLMAKDATSASLFSIDGSWDFDTRIVSLLPGSNRLHYVGSINIEPQRRQIERIVFGFDARYNPMIFFIQSGSHSLESDVKNAVSVDRVIGLASLYPQDVALHGGKEALICRKDFWGFRVDRWDGFDGYVVREKDGSAEGDVYSPLAHVHLRRTTVDGKLVWGLDIDELAPREPRVVVASASTARSSASFWSSGNSQHGGRHAVNSFRDSFRHLRHLVVRGGRGDVQSRDSTDSGNRSDDDLTAAPTR